MDRIARIARIAWTGRDGSRPAAATGAPAREKRVSRQDMEALLVLELGLLPPLAD